MQKTLKIRRNLVKYIQVFKHIRKIIPFALFLLSFAAEILNTISERKIHRWSFLRLYRI